MKTLHNQLYLIAYIVSNVIAIIFLLSSWKWPRLSRLLFFILFLSASFLNFRIALRSPEVYLDFDELTIFHFYKSFIKGWFSGHIVPMITFIAGSQALIAISFLLKGLIYRVGLTGGIIFLVAIAPFGVGSAFPCTLIMAVALALLYRQDRFLWHYNSGKFTVKAD